MNERERLEYIIDILCAGSQAEFGRRTAITPSAVNKLIKGELNLTEYYISKICKAFADLNPQFLRDGVSYPGDISVQVVRSKYEAEVKKLNGEIAEWKSQAATMRKALEIIISSLST